MSTTDGTPCTPRGQQRQHQRQQHHQYHQKWEQRYRRERQLLKEAEDAAAAYAYLANALGLRAKHLPSARHAKMAIDGLQIAIAAHQLAADLFAELEVAA